jgi:hypothetical protein
VKVRVHTDNGWWTVDDGPGRMQDRGRRIDDWWLAVVGRGWKNGRLEGGSVCSLEPFACSGQAVGTFARLPVGGWRISSRICVLCI